VYRNDPGRLHRSLRELSAGDSTPQPAPSLPRSRDGVAEEFGRLVDRQLAGPVLPYSRRVALLREAARRGIGRFEANLIIALVQHRRGEGTGMAGDRKPATGRPRRLAPVVGAVLFVESLVVAYGWWLLALR
jgi:hypothetical protein